MTSTQRKPGAIGESDYSTTPDGPPPDEDMAHSTFIPEDGTAVEVAAYYIAQRDGFGQSSEHYYWEAIELLRARPRK